MTLQHKGNWLLKYLILEAQGFKSFNRKQVKGLKCHEKNKNSTMVKKTSEVNIDNEEFSIFEQWMALFFER